MRQDFLRGSFATTLATLVFLLGRPASTAQQPPGTMAAFPQFKAHLVDRLPGGYKVAVVDIDRDGKPDIVGLATTPASLAWYKNPDWERHALTAQARDYIDLAPQDIDGDGRIDLAVAHEFGMARTSSGGLISWLKCPEDPMQDWPMHAIGAEPTSHRIKWGDIDGDGRRELIDAPIMGRGAKGPLWDVGTRLLAYHPPGSPATEPWKSTVIDNQLTVIHGMAVVDWDQNGRDDILTASFAGVHLYRPGNATGERKTRLASGEQDDPAKRGSSEIVVGKAGHNAGRFLATIEPWHGDKVVVYTPDPDPHVTWQRTVIDATFNEGHALLCADVDADGEDEIVAGYRGKGQSLYLYDRVGSTHSLWKRIPLDEGDMAASGLDVADINADGRLDIVCVGTASSNIKWYENLGPLRRETSRLPALPSSGIAEPAGNRPARHTPE